jgi:hypothetical protein
MNRRRSGDADQLNILARNYTAPIVRDVLDLKFMSDRLRVLAMRARNRHHTRAPRAKARNLRRASEARTDDPNAGHLFQGQINLLSSCQMETLDEGKH